MNNTAVTLCSLYHYKCWYYANPVWWYTWLLEALVSSYEVVQWAGTGVGDVVDKEIPQ